MTPVFADTSFYYALLSPKDRHHEAAVRLSAQITGLVLTAEFVLLELGNGMSAPDAREAFVNLVQALHEDEEVEIVPASDRLFEDALELDASRRDKSWSLTDCSSFVVMQQRGLTTALSADHHFEQAGFTILLR